MELAQRTVATNSLIGPTHTEIKRIRNLQGQSYEFERVRCHLSLSSLYLMGLDHAYACCEAVNFVQSSPNQKRER